MHHSFYNYKVIYLIHGLVCQTHLLRTPSAVRNTEKNFPHNQPGETSNPIKCICSFSLLSLLQNQNTFSQTRCCSFLPCSQMFPHTCSPRVTHHQQVPCTGPLTSEGYKQVAVIGVVSSHRSGGYKHISDKLCLNGGRKQPSAPVQASLTLLPRNNQAALLQQVQEPELIFGN